jgi:probable rRNA maturation factor
LNLIDLQVIDKNVYFPSVDKMQCWVDCTLSDYTVETELVIRIVNQKEISELNEKYRGKKGSTNILSFTFEQPVGIKLDLLGDLVICAAVVNNEAKQQNKDLDAHWAHIVIHGVLHLLGFDHIKAQEAEIMENKEVSILQSLNISNPYLETD